MNNLKTAARTRTVIGRDYSGQYRDSDEVEVRTENHEHLCSSLGQISRSLGNRITALDLGCGTGRYFHCLQNIETLTAVDISLEMLKQARVPVRQEAINIGRIHLVCASILDIHLPAHFDLIYSIGAFGEHVPWDLATCNRLYDALKPGGKLFLTLVDVLSKYPYMSKKRRIAETVNLILPPVCKRKLRQRLGTFYMAEREITSIFRKSKFGNFKTQRRVSTARLWKGAHYECLAIK